MNKIHRLELSHSLNGLREEIREMFPMTAKEQEDWNANTITCVREAIRSEMGLDKQPTQEPANTDAVLTNCESAMKGLTDEVQQFKNSLRSCLDILSKRVEKLEGAVVGSIQNAIANSIPPETVASMTEKATASDKSWHVPDDPILIEVGDAFKKWGMADPVDPSAAKSLFAGRLGWVLERLRKRSGLNGFEVSGHIGLESPENLSGIELGRNIPNDATLRRMLHVYDVPFRLWPQIERLRGECVVAMGGS